ncbi:hypothetical protein D3C74_318020 [compost metagenome]
MPKQQSESELYRLERFSYESLLCLPQRTAAYAEAIQGLLQTHSEVFYKRGWLLPYLLPNDDLLWGRWSYWLDILQNTELLKVAAQLSLSMQERGLK